MDQQKYSDATALLYPPSYPGDPQYTQFDQNVTMQQPIQTQPVQIQPPPVMLMAQPTIVFSAGFSHQPQKMNCPMCQANMVTRVEFRSCQKTHLYCVLLCLLGCCCCCCIPYCSEGAQEATHYCTKCNAFLGSHQP